MRTLTIQVHNDRASVGRAAAAHIRAAVGGGRFTLGVATGSTPVETYAALAKTRSDGEYDGLECFALDEYVGLPPGDPGLYRSVLDDAVSAPLGLDPGQLKVPDPTAPDAYDRAIAQAGGIDLQLLGIGRNGHIGFNEPGSAFDSRTRIVALADETRQDNARFFAGRAVPTHAVTQGVGTILEARSILMLATGRGKAEAVHEALRGPVDEQVPASSLQRHPDVVVMLDAEAAMLL